MRIRKSLLIAFVLGFLLAGIAQAQSNGITATVDRSSLSTDDTLTLTVTVSTDNSNLPQPDMPVMDGFDIVNSGSSSQISMFNGAVSAQVIYTFRLRPTKTGQLTIGAFTVTINGQTYSSDPIEVSVSQGTGQPQSGSSGSTQSQPAPSSLNGQRVFVEAVVDNDSPYVGQQVTYSFRLYQAVSLNGRPQYVPPEFTGFWHDQQPDQKQYRTQVGGITYQVTQLQTVLFPTSAGEVTIEPTTLIVPGGFFEADSRLQTDSITLTVKPLPDGAPADFSGAVGQFTVDASLDSDTVQAGDPVTLHVTVDGTGNISALPEPEWQAPDNWRSFDPNSTTTTGMRGDKYGGSKVFDRLLIPNSGGNYTLPPVTLSYFDPEAGAYKQASSQPLAIAVSGDTSSDVAKSASNADTAAPDTTEAVPAALVLAPLKEVDTVLDLAPLPLTGRSIYWLAWGVPLVMLGGSFVYERRQRYLDEHDAARRRSRAYKEAQRALKRARKQPGDGHEAAGRILAGYLEAKLDRSIKGLTHAQLSALLAENGIANSLASQASTILYSIDVLRFGRGAADGQADILDTTRACIDALEKEFAQ